MDSNEIRELAAIMREMELTTLEYKSGDESIKLTRKYGVPSALQYETSSVKFEAPKEVPSPAGTFTVKSPMVGVFYSAPGVDEEPYVALGDTVHAGDVLCIIEVMKIMNEITAERDGVITEICVQNKDVVEFGQPLFRIGTL